MNYETYDLSDPLKPTILFDPSEKKDFGRDFADVMTSDTDSISTYDVIPGDGLVLHGKSLLGSAVLGLVSATKTSGTIRLKCIANTLEGRTWVRSVYLKLKQR